MPGEAVTTTWPPRLAVPPTLMRSLWPEPATSVTYVPLADCAKLLATLIVPIELPGEMTFILNRLPPTEPLPERTPRFRTSPLTAPLLTNEPPLPLMTDPPMSPVFAALPTLARLPSIVPLLMSVPWFDSQ